jgi:hypothetical protein
MRPIVLIAGLVLSAAPVVAFAQSSTPSCAKPTTLIGAVSALFGRSACRAPATDGAPGAGQAVGPPRREPERADEPGRAQRRLATTMCREALPSYDAGGQATYLPSRACGRY